MIDLTAQDIAEFRALHRRETGRDLSDDEARRYALSIIQLVAFVVKHEARSRRQATQEPPSPIRPDNHRSSGNVSASSPSA